jgi:hypothetical protein
LHFLSILTTVLEQLSIKTDILGRISSSEKKKKNENYIFYLPSLNEIFSFLKCSINQFSLKYFLGGF